MILKMDPLTLLLTVNYFLTVKLYMLSLILCFCFCQFTLIEPTVQFLPNLTASLACTSKKLFRSHMYEYVRVTTLVISQGTRWRIHMWPLLPGTNPPSSAWSFQQHHCSHWLCTQLSINSGIGKLEEVYGVSEVGTGGNRGGPGRAETPRQRKDRKDTKVNGELRI